MNILVVDFLFVEAHRSVNVNMIYSLSAFANIDVCSLNGFYDDSKQSFINNGINIVEIKTKRIKGPIGSRVFSYNLMKKTAKLLNDNNKYDAIVCLGFDTIVLGVGYTGFNGIPLFVFHHKNIDELTNRIKRIAFNTYKNKVYHVVFENYFKLRLVDDIKVQSDKVFVIPHPVNPVDIIATDMSFDCVGLCSSNDERFIEDVLNSEEIFAEEGFNVLLRSKSIEKNSGSVVIVKGFLERKVYDELMSSAKAVFVPLPNTYKYRLSGSIYDALSRRKKVYTTSRFYVEEYGIRYPGTCFYVETVDQLLDMIRNEEEGKTDSFEKFIFEHSITSVSQAIEDMINSILKV